MRSTASMDHEDENADSAFITESRDRNGEICSAMEDRPSKIGLFLERGGRWQTFQIGVLYFAALTSDMQTMTIVFNGFQPKFACIDGEDGYNYTERSNATSRFNDQCTVVNTTLNTSSACGGGFRYDVNRHETIVAEWDLICDKAYLSEVSQVLYTIGMALGSAFIPPISDRFGRKKSHLGIRAVFILCVFGLALSPNVFVFMGLRLMTGTVGMGLTLVRFVYMMELIPIRYRPCVAMMTGLLWATNLCVEAGIAQLMKGMNWRYLQVAISLPTLSMILDAVFLKESLLWLHANGKIKEASKLLKTAMKANGITDQELITTEEATRFSHDVNDSSELKGDKSSGYRMIPNADTANANDIQTLGAKTDYKISDVKESSKSRGDETDGYRLVPSVETTCTKDIPAKKTKAVYRKLNIIDLLKNKSTRKIVPIVCFTWFVNSLVYYGIFLMSNAMAGDRILNFFLSAIVEIPSYLVLYFCLRWCGRKTLLVSLHLLCAVSLLLAGVFHFTLTGDAKVVAMQVVTFIGKFGISATFTLIFVYTTEVFPTNFRTSGLGLASLTARFGSFLSPFSSVLVRKLPWGPGIIFGGLCLVLTFTLFLAPETRNRTLPQGLEDIEAWESDKMQGVVRKEKNGSKSVERSVP